MEAGGGESWTQYNVGALGLWKRVKGGRKIRKHNRGDIMTKACYMQVRKCPDETRYFKLKIKCDLVPWSWTRKAWNILGSTKTGIVC